MSLIVVHNFKKKLNKIVEPCGKYGHEIYYYRVCKDCGFKEEVEK